MERYADEVLKANKIQSKPDIDKVMLRKFMEHAGS